MRGPRDDATLRLHGDATGPSSRGSSLASSLESIDDPRGEEGLEEGLALANLKRALFPDAPQQRIGRYEIRGVLGRGGMGVVYRAHDPELSRDVAVKVLSKTTPDSASPARLLREARALASLTHENLLPIYDVGVDSDLELDPGLAATDDERGALYIVTELIEGQTLTAWLSRPGRTTPQILRVFAAAARGLMAAHAQGFVHRDFKPSNVLIGDDGRVRVGDFGLVATSSSRDDLRTRRPSSSLLEVHEPSTSACHPGAQLALAELPDSDERLSQTNVVLGTPGFIAPEHLRGFAVDDRADQYAFCVSLYLALVHRHPFFDDDESRTRLHDRPYRPPPPSCAVPARVRRLLARGLSHDPRRRFRSMAPIVEALDACAGDRSRGRAAPVLLGLAGLSVLGLVGLAPPAGPPCASGSTLASVWGDAPRQRVQQAIAAVDVDYAQDAARVVVSRLDQYADAWGEGYDAACRQARTASTPATVARLGCYHDRLDMLAAMTRVLADADAESLAGAEAAVQTLPPLLPCETGATFDEPDEHEHEHEHEHEATLDPVDAAKLRALHAETEVLLSARRHADATQRATEARARATALGWRWGRLEAHRHLARAHRLAGRFDAAAEAYEAVYFEAVQVGEHRLSLRSALGRLNVATARPEAETGRRWAEHARALLAAHDIGDDMTLELEVERNAAMIELSDGQIQLGLGQLERVLERAEAHFGPDHPETTEARSDLGLALLAAGRNDDALPLARRVLEERIAQSGPRHPGVALSRATLAHVLLRVDQPEPAERELRDALEIFDAAGLSESLGAAQTLMTLGTLLTSDGRDDEGLEAHERALAIRIDALGPDHPKVASAQTSVGMAAVEAGDREGGLELLAAALATTEAALGPDNFQAGHIHYQIALIEKDAGHPDAAIEHMQAAAHAMAAELGPGHVRLAWPLSQLSRWSDDPSEKLDLAQRASSIAEAGEPGSDLQANVELALAEARRSR